jgi:hypothetical protein
MASMKRVRRVNHIQDGMPVGDAGWNGMPLSPTPLSSLSCSLLAVSWDCICEGGCEMCVDNSVRCKAVRDSLVRMYAHASECCLSAPLSQGQGRGACSSCEPPAAVRRQRTRGQAAEQCFIVGPFSWTVVTHLLCASSVLQLFSLIQSSHAQAVSECVTGVAPSRESLFPPAACAFYQKETIGQGRAVWLR